ncbi:N-acetylmuramoyl-L-alanine amidase [Bacillus velezensis]|uniref:N-acetylmuramoyl-L-alanine amidase n=1 Tax=Bacillus velezensis TaxID=492670 RepID=UPI0018C635EE|nr:N-acetylmuramoyl-L-alanine amidase [Bacillus velezensis]QPK89714.1 N-acetylmuramoyl-L-alanine amidase [Bacillus velezensis]
MGKKLIALDDGHGMQTPGKRSPILPSGKKSETGNFMHENEFNRAVVKYLDAELKRNGFSTLLVAPTDADTPLSTRTNTANAKGADIYISIHANANTGQFGNWGGIETYTYPNGESRKLGNIVHKHMLKGSPLQDRKVRDGSGLWVIRKTRMPAILVECGFMDSHKDIEYLLSDAYRRECAREICQGVCEYYGVNYKAEAKKETPKKTEPKDKKNGDLYRVVVGSFKDKDGAEKRQKELKAKKVDSFLLAYKEGKTTYYRVVAGSFSEKKNADAVVKDLNKKGFEAFVAVYDK